MRVLLADDHALFRAGLATLLKAWGLDVVSQAGTGEEAIARARELHPDLIFMDINMPNLNGLEATRAIKAESPDVKVVILTVSDDEQDLFEAIKSGAEGYLLKNLREEEFAALVSRIQHGEPVMSPGLAKRLLHEFARLRAEPHRLEEEVGLTDREHQVLDQVARGATNKEIAAALYISQNTVNYHMKNILSKLHLRNRAQVVAWALEHGFARKQGG
ncbi:MAG: response regulator transcription factor [Chloroflexi bacterium]|nr:response regulator transcription factor [Chloroflexota bacterium]